MFNIAKQISKGIQGLSSLQGKKKKIKREHFERLGEGLGLTPKQLSVVFNRFHKYKAEAIQWINNSFLTPEMKEEITGTAEIRETFKISKSLSKKGRELQFDWLKFNRCTRRQ